MGRGGQWGSGNVIKSLLNSARDSLVILDLTRQGIYYVRVATVIRFNWTCFFKKRCVDKVADFYSRRTKSAKKIYNT